MKNLSEYIESITNISETDWHVFSYLKKREFSKKSVFLSLGQIEKNVSFIEKGEVRLFIPIEDINKEITFGFSFLDEFISAYVSFLTQTPSLYQLQALSDTILWNISYKALQEVDKRTKISNTISRFISEKLFLIKSKREQSLLNETQTIILRSLRRKN
jgi:CRP-like cAMP-binding protein